ncbi:MAG: hypothetical protein U0136_16925 [Bdellovibrionota bacterium]
MLGRLNKLFEQRRYAALVLVPTIIFSSTARADNPYASEQRRNAALGHWGRARAMLVEALAEFEQGNKYARPDMLINPEEFRLSIISHTEELNRLLDPKPKVTRDGVQFQASPRLIRREKDRTPQPAEVARDTNVYGEKQRLQERRDARARMDSPDREEDAVKVIPRTAQQTAEQAPASAEPDHTVAKKAAQSLSFDNPKAAAPQEAEDDAAPADSGNVVAGSETPDIAPAPAEPVDQKAEQAAPPADSATAKAVPAKPLKLIPDEEEVVTTHKVEAPTEKKNLFSNDEDEEDTSARKTETVESKEDEVTKEIERAIQERMAKEKGKAEAAQADETSGE